MDDILIVALIPSVAALAGILLSYYFGRQSEAHKQSLERRMQAYASFINLYSKIMVLDKKVFQFHKKLGDLSRENEETGKRLSRVRKKALGENISREAVDLIGERLSNRVKALCEEKNAVEAKQIALGEELEEVIELFIRSSLTVILVGSVKVVKELYKLLKTNTETDKDPGSRSLPKVVSMMRADVSNKGGLPLYVISNLIFSVTEVTRKNERST